MTIETPITKFSWLWAIVVGVLLGGVTAAAVTQSQVDDLRTDVTELKTARIHTAEDIADIKATQREQTRSLGEIKTDLKTILREMNDDRQQNKR